MRLPTSYFLVAVMLLGGSSHAQSVSPMIVEYSDKAQGTIALSNNTALAMAVVLEARSFTVTSDGDGLYRPLDSSIRVKLSSNSVRLEPGQTYYVVYQASAKRRPAWFTIFSTFLPLEHRPGFSVRISLPHTVYIYPKTAPARNVVEVVRAAYSKEARRLVCDISNDSGDLERVRDIRLSSDSKQIASPGFPLLPGAKRHLELAWKEADPPREIAIRLRHSTVHAKLSTID